MLDSVVVVLREAVGALTVRARVGRGRVRDMRTDRTRLHLGIVVSAVLEEVEAQKMAEVVHLVGEEVELRVMLSDSWRALQRLLRLKLCRSFVELKLEEVVSFDLVLRVVV